MSSSAESARKRYHRLVSERLCPKCTMPARPGRVLCGPCADLMNDCVARRRERLRLDRKCIDCGVNEVAKGSGLWCPGCADRRRNYMADYWRSRTKKVREAKRGEDNN